MQRVAAMGLHPVAAPVLEIAPLAPRLPPARTLQALLVTSGNALPALPAAYHGLTLLAVGDATARRATEAGFTLVHSAGRDAVALALLTTRLCDPAGAALLLAAGRGQGTGLAARLRATGFTLIRRSVYAAYPAAALPDAACAALMQGGLRSALFFSPACAHAFVSLLQAALPAKLVERIEALAISEPTAAALAPLPWRRIRVASNPNQDELLALLR
ncbi:uroporphyrinogen-III synthase [Limobrevibacterium gyesilva]|uniref:Uroporphyrinogen-III synthase n=1 Tax=Limobrevibacterium gyesilva TaxID=2991712 RepID=A0AA42CDZ9_9PROT|nr:uroporphyrinogen-III synthase [Limobrevibacterium gyesilva]MCW3474604.1 uroporphyrinogen-III synthase [Limobrevibacterium gyesilva]